MEWNDLERDVPQWFERSKLGIFIHWGAYSVAGWAEPTAKLGEIPGDEGWYGHNPYAEWYFNSIRIPNTPAYEHHQKVWGGKPYDVLLDEWKAEEFDAQELVDLFHSVGAGYLVLTTKHHDGITLWDAPGTGNRNTVARGPKKDLVDAYVKATRKAGMRFGAYYSGGLDWWFRHLPAHLSDESVHDKDRPKDAEYAAYALDHLKDLVERYQPDMLWNDINWPDAGKELNTPYALGNFFAEYYAACPQGVVNDRWRVPHADFLTSEYVADLENESKGIWENCRGLGLSFGYNQVESLDHAMSPEEILTTLVDFASRGGRLLLGVGPKADGTLPQWQVDLLLAIKPWMNEFGEMLSGVSRAGNTEVSTESWHRVAQGDDSEYLFIEKPANADEAKVKLQQPLTSVSPEWATVTEGDGCKIIKFNNKVGPAVFKIG